MIVRIGHQLASRSPYAVVELLQELDALCEKGMAVRRIPEDKRSCIESLNTKIAKLPLSWQHCIDGWVYTYSPPPKGGDAWGKHHRFDRLDLLQRSVRAALREGFKGEIASRGNFSSPHDSAAFFRGLHSIAIGPQVEDPALWAEEHLPYLMPLVPPTFEALKNLENFIELYQVDALDGDYQECFKKANSPDIKMVENFERQIRERYTLVQLNQMEFDDEEIAVLTKKYLSPEIAEKLDEIKNSLQNPPEECQVQWGRVAYGVGLRKLLLAINRFKVIFVLKANTKKN